jgi:hypothetical protein
MAQYVFVTATGALFSWTPNDTDPVAPPAQLAAQGMSVVSGLPALSATEVWSPTQQTVVSQAAPVAPNNIPTFEFILLFTPAEHNAIISSTDAQVTQFLMALSVTPTVNLNDTKFVGPGMAHLVSLGLLTQANATLILSGQPSQ